MAPENQVTYKVLNDTTKELKREIMGHVDSVKSRVDDVDNKVDQLNDLVLPMVVSMRQTADNTKEMTESLKDFTKSQRDTNDLLKEKIHEHDLSIEQFKSFSAMMSDKKKYNATIVVALIGVMGVLITSIFNMAPLFFGS